MFALFMLFFLISFANTEFSTVLSSRVYSSLPD